MTDIEKVIKKLKACRKTDCINCPYALETDVCLVKYIKEQHERIEVLESLRRIEQEGR